MGLLPRLHLPQDPLLLSSFAFLLASLSATQAEGASSLEISFLWSCLFPPRIPEEIQLGWNLSVRGVRVT